LVPESELNRAKRVRLLAVHPDKIEVHYPHEMENAKRATEKVVED